MKYVTSSTDFYADFFSLKSLSQKGSQFTKAQWCSRIRFCRFVFRNGLGVHCSTECDVKFVLCYCPRLLAFIICLFSFWGVFKVGCCANRKVLIKLQNRNSSISNSPLKTCIEMDNLPEKIVRFSDRKVPLETEQTSRKQGKHTTTK